MSFPEPIRDAGEQRNRPFQRRVILNLGSGRKHLADAVNLDAVPETSPDILHDLNVRPWPLASESFEVVIANDVIEHLEDVVKTMEEIHRVCRDHAIVRITVPHFSCANAFTDPTHRHYFSAFSFSYFTGEHEFSFYSQYKFRCRKRQVIFKPTYLNRLIWRIAERHTSAWEKPVGMDVSRLVYLLRTRSTQRLNSDRLLANDPRLCSRK